MSHTSNLEILDRSNGTGMSRLSFVRASDSRGFLTLDSTVLNPNCSDASYISINLILFQGGA